MAKTRKVRHLNKPVIPKIIHQIWVGNNIMPEEWMDTVVKFSKDYDYEYKLWTEKNIDTLPWDSVKGLRKAYSTMKSTGKLAGCGDIIRYLALYEFGGLYIDVDTVIVKPKQFNVFLHSNTASVFFAWEIKDKKYEKFGFSRLVANSVIGSTIHAPFMKHVLDGIPSRLEKSKNKSPWIVVGPVYITKEYTKNKIRFPDIKIYPMRYFYPIMWHGITDSKLHTKIKIPKESMLFQYGYSTNNFKMYFNNCNCNTRKRRAN